MDTARSSPLPTTSLDQAIKLCNRYFDLNDHVDTEFVLGYPRGFFLGGGVTCPLRTLSNVIFNCVCLPDEASTLGCRSSLDFHSCAESLNRLASDSDAEYDMNSEFGSR
jgi:hypothetical protein